MIIAADANVLIELVTDKSSYRAFYQLFDKNHYKLALPTPVIAEFLVYDNNFERFNFLNQVNAFSQNYLFDLKSAKVTAEITRDFKHQDLKSAFAESSNYKGWQGTKVDIQILGMCVANRISKILTADTDITSIVNALDLPVEVIDIAQMENIDLQPKLL